MASMDPGIHPRSRMWPYPLRWALTLCLGLACLLSSGCAALFVGAGAGAAGVAYAKGELHEELVADPRDIAAAAEKAFEALDLRTISAASSAVDALVVGRAAADRRITLRVRVGPQGQSRLSIRVGSFGDETISRRIHEEIRRHLDAGSPARDHEAADTAI